MACPALCLVSVLTLLLSEAVLDTPLASPESPGGSWHLWGRECDLGWSSGFREQPDASCLAATEKSRPSLWWEQGLKEGGVQAVNCLHGLPRKC